MCVSGGPVCLYKVSRVGLLGISVNCRCHRNSSYWSGEGHVVWVLILSVCNILVWIILLEKLVAKSDCFTLVVKVIWWRGFLRSRIIFLPRARLANVGESLLSLSLL